MAQPELGTPSETAARHASLPSLHHLLDRIAGGLESRGEMGLLYVTVLPRKSVEPGAGWLAYEALVDEIAAFLAGYRRRRMRSADLLIEPTVRGNAFVLLLDPPRGGRAIDEPDLAHVKRRLRRGLREHLARALGPACSDAFGCHVGGALMRRDPDVRTDRIVYRALEEAFADALHDRSRESRRPAVQLHRVLSHGLVHSVYQPVVDLPRRRVIGYEALTRVEPRRFPSTDHLFRAATDNDSLWSLERLCRRKALEGLPHLTREQRLFLNVQPEAIHDPQLRDATFLDALAGAGLSPDRIVLEMTEHTAVQDFEGFRRTLLHFRSQGFLLAMDDVGSGYSGLQSIAELAPDFIKIDMGLVRDIHRSPIKRELIATIRRFSDSTGITLIAEGVERPEELASLVEAGVRCAQGYLFAKPGAPPLPPDWEVLEIASL